jgi:hypothetical protein
MLRKITATLFLLTIVLIGACSHYDELQKNGKESTLTARSHNAGEDCMTCHHDAGSEAYSRWWYVAGTAYSSDGTIAASAGEVQLWTGPRATGSLIYKLPIDENGNFYTEKIINFRGGYFPVIISANDTFAMSEMVNGDNIYKSCNNCHGHNGNDLNTPAITLK